MSNQDLQELIEKMKKRLKEKSPYMPTDYDAGANDMIKVVQDSAKTSKI